MRYKKRFSRLNLSCFNLRSITLFKMLYVSYVKTILRLFQHILQRSNDSTIYMIVRSASVTFKSLASPPKSYEMSKNPIQRLEVVYSIYIHMFHIVTPWAICFYFTSPLIIFTLQRYTSEIHNSEGYEPVQGGESPQ